MGRAILQVTGTRGSWEPLPQPLRARRVSVGQLAGMTNLVGRAGFLPDAAKKAQQAASTRRGPNKMEARKMQTFFIYRIADRAVKPCRSSISTTRGGMAKQASANTTNKNKSQTKHKKPTHWPAASVRGRVKQTVKRRWDVRSTHKSSQSCHRGMASVLEAAV